MNPVLKFEVLLVTLQLIAFILGMIFERKLQALKDAYESQD